MGVDLRQNEGSIENGGNGDTSSNTISNSIPIVVLKSGFGDREIFALRLVEIRRWIHDPESSFAKAVLLDLTSLDPKFTQVGSNWRSAGGFG